MGLAENEKAWRLALPVPRHFLDPGFGLASGERLSQRPPLGDHGNSFRILIAGSRSNGNSLHQLSARATLSHQHRLAQRLWRSGGRCGWRWLVGSVFFWAGGAPRALSPSLAHEISRTPPPPP